MVELRLGRPAPPRPVSPPAAFTGAGAEVLAAEDPHLHALLCAEHAAREENLVLRAGGHCPDASVPAASAATPSASREPAAGAGPVERLAVARALEVFGASYADIGPASGQEAVARAVDALAASDEVVLDARPAPGPPSLAGRRVESWPLPTGAGAAHEVLGHNGSDHDGLDYDGLAAAAERVRPAVLLCGGGPHPLTPDFARLRSIADSVGALLVADLAHLAGPVAAGLLPTPIDQAHVTTACTATSLPGGRGGLVLTGRDARRPVRDALLVDLLADRAARTAPDPSTAAGTARVLGVALTDTYREQVARTALAAAELAAELVLLGHRVPTGGTDNHVVLLEPDPEVAQFAVDALGEVNLLVDTAPGRPGALVLDLTTAGWRGFGRGEARRVAQLVDEALRGVRARDGGYRLDPFTRLSVRDAVLRLLWQFPLPRHVSTTLWRNTP
jgi:glycine hydroxymethyltransferase